MRCAAGAGRLGVGLPGLPPPAARTSHQFRCFQGPAVPTASGDPAQKVGAMQTWGFLRNTPIHSPMGGPQSELSAQT